MTLDLGSEGRTEFEMCMLEETRALLGDPANDGPVTARRRHRGRSTRPMSDSRAILSQILDDVDAFHAERALNAQRARARFYVVGSASGAPRPDDARRAGEPARWT